MLPLLNSVTKDIYSNHAKKPTTDYTTAAKKKRCHAKCPTSHCRRSVSHWWGQSQVAIQSWLCWYWSQN